MITKEFALAGDARFTVEPDPAWAAGRGCPPHWTFRLRRVEFAGGRTCLFASLLTGPDNEASYTYLGVVREDTGEVRLTAKSGLADDSWPVRVLRRVLARLFAGEGAAVEAAGWKVHHEGRCGRCGRVLTVPESIETGIGPECAKRMAG